MLEMMRDRPSSVRDHYISIARDATALQRLGELTDATVLQLLLPLLIVLMTSRHSPLSASRERCASCSALL